MYIHPINLIVNDEEDLENQKRMRNYISEILNNDFFCAQDICDIINHTFDMNLVEEIDLDTIKSDFIDDNVEKDDNSLYFWKDTIIVPYARNIILNDDDIKKYLKIGKEALKKIYKYIVEKIAVHLNLKENEYSYAVYYIMKFKQSVPKYPKFSILQKKKKYTYNSYLHKLKFSRAIIDTKANLMSFDTIFAAIGIQIKDKNNNHHLALYNQQNAKFLIDEEIIPSMIEALISVYVEKCKFDSIINKTKINYKGGYNNLIDHFCCACAHMNYNPKLSLSSYITEIEYYLQENSKIYEIIKLI